MLIAITQRTTKYADHPFDLTHKCIKVIYTSFWVHNPLGI